MQYSPIITIEVVSSKWSGANNFPYLFEKQLKKPLLREKHEKMRSAIKSLATELYFTASEVVERWKKSIFE